ncbi:MAG: hypothetical protein HYR48_08770 [Gemmatimonadetes bacterium]|nr:hypothetical protein [Gemmatimonadota bacterium]
MARIVGTALAGVLLAALVGAPAAHAQDPPPFAEVVSGQELIYRGHFSAAQLYFSRLGEERAGDPVGPALEASALIWWGEARSDEAFQADLIDSLLADAIARAEDAVQAAPPGSAQATALFWLGTALGYRARQAELRGRYWRAARDAKAMRTALEQARALDSTCIDCLLGLAIYDYALARASAIARLVARIIGLGGGDAERGLERLRLVSEQGLLTRTEGRWVYANALLRESEREGALREEARRLVGELATQFPENPVFKRFLDSSGAAP